MRTWLSPLWIRDVSPQAVSAGLLASFVGFASSFAIILQGLRAAGASEAQAASGLMSLSVAMGLCGVVLSLRTRMPVGVAWSTPGAVLLTSSAAVEGGFPYAVGAFLVVGGLIVLAGLWRPLGRLVSAIPMPLASAMLAGVLLPRCLAPVQAVAQAPLSGLAIVLAWALVGQWRRVLAVPAAVLVAGSILAATGPALPPFNWWPHPVLVAPAFSAAALIGTALPLFIVTMASQNLSGIAVLAAYGYRPASGPLFATTGLFTLLAAPFGAHAINLAAITAAICAGPDSHPDPARRWPAATVAGLGYIAFGLTAGAATAFIAASPPLLIEAVAGLALLGALAAALQSAVADPDAREAALITFLVSASGVTVLGIGGAAWGLLAGGALLTLQRRR